MHCMAELQLGAVEDISFNSKDGTEIHGIMVKPPSYDASKKYPLVLWIHGGPNGQDDHALAVQSVSLASGAADICRPGLRGAGHQLSRQQRAWRGIYPQHLGATGETKK